MIENTRKTTFGLSSDFYRTSVGLFCAMLLTTSGAVAGAWSEFEQRCLAPFEAVERPDLSGLTKGAATIFGQLGEGFAQTADANAVYTFPAAELELMVIAPSDRAYSGCMVVGRGAAADAADQRAADAWLQVQIEAERYDEVAGSVLGPAYHSTVWREPKLRFVRLITDAPRVVVYGISETDYES
ncbi:hypothetical protein [Litoreibacter roseus]|uniref:Uncharacterized protein n=1 Tax=Litoreibacter roseus TaxID=2601869 RepID=A0A6N6JMB2_9RHOB|nr:hypothetical protein [Litoreibacter roseus]GFE66332.1 hypothetical protein KIN_34060 [Litoreibacter roseus]